MSQLKSVKTIESAEDKLGWIFTAFDEDGGGTMDPEEVAQIVLGLFRFVIVVVVFVVVVVVVVVIFIVDVGKHRGGTRMAGCCAFFVVAIVISLILIIVGMVGVPEDDDMMPSCVNDVFCCSYNCHRFCALPFVV